jgi:hypothetical protein
MQDITSENTQTLTVQTRMDSGNENEDISLTSTIIEDDNRKKCRTDKC